MLVLQGHKHAVRSVAWSPEGEFLASGGDDHTVRLWRLASAEMVDDMWKGHQRNVYAVGFTPEGRSLISAAGDGQVRLWSVPAGYMRTTPAVHTRSVNCLAVHPQGSVATADGAWRSPGRAIMRRLVQARPGEQGPALRSSGLTLTFDRNEISCLAYAPDGERLAVGTPQFLFLWKPQRRRSQTMRFAPLRPGRLPAVEATVAGELTLLCEGTWYRSVSFSPDGSLLAAAAGSDVEVWSVARNVRAGVLRGHLAAVQATSFSPMGGLLASASENGEARLWDAAALQERTRFAWNIGPLHSAAFSPDGLALAVGGQGRIVVWDVEQYY